MLPCWQTGSYRDSGGTTTEGGVKGRWEAGGNNRADRCFLGNFLRRVESIFVNNEAKTNCVNL